MEVSNIDQELVFAQFIVSDECRALPALLHRSTGRQVACPAPEG